VLTLEFRQQTLSFLTGGTADGNFAKLYGIRKNHFPTFLVGFYEQDSSNVWHNDLTQTPARHTPTNPR
jgi:hypothetical protein